MSRYTASETQNRPWGQRAQLAVARAIAFLHQSQLSYGEFELLSSASRDMYVCASDSSPSATAFVLYSLRFVDDPELSGKLAEMESKALRFLIEEMEAPGVWRFWSSRNTKRIDPDVDDTCYISVLLRRHHPHILLGSNHAALLAQRNDEGLFRTWFRDPCDSNDVDSVVNANVLFYLGERPETIGVCDYLNEIILTGREKGSYWYYDDELWLYYAMSRAFFHGARRLGRSRSAIGYRIAGRQHQNGGMGDDLSTALAACTLLNFGLSLRQQRAALGRAVLHLLARQMEDGSWPQVAAATGPPPPHARSVWWGSKELTTAIALEAITRFRSAATPDAQQ